MMFVFTRLVNESIQLGDDVKVTVLEIIGNTVKLGATAPPEMSVQRAEVYVLNSQTNESKDIYSMTDLHIENGVSGTG